MILKLFTVRVSFANLGSRESCDDETQNRNVAECLSRLCCPHEPTKGELEWHVSG